MCRQLVGHSHLPGLFPLQRMKHPVQGVQLARAPQFHDHYDQAWHALRAALDWQGLPPPRPCPQAANSHEASQHAFRIGEMAEWRPRSQQHARSVAQKRRGATSCSSQCCICQRRCNASTSGLGPLASKFCLAAWSCACSARYESPPSCSSSPTGTSLTASVTAGVLPALSCVSWPPCIGVREHGVAAPGATTSMLIGNSLCSVCSVCSGPALSGACASGVYWYSCCSPRAASLPPTARCFPSTNNLSGAAISCWILGFRGYRPSYTRPCIHSSMHTGIHTCMHTNWNMSTNVSATI